MDNQGRWPSPEDITKMSVWYAHNLYVQAVCEHHRSMEGKQGHMGMGVHRGTSREHPIVSHIPAGRNLVKF